MDQSSTYGASKKKLNFYEIEKLFEEFEENI